MYCDMYVLCSTKLIPLKYRCPVLVNQVNQNKVKVAFWVESDHLGGVGIQNEELKIGYVLTKYGNNNNVYKMYTEDCDMWQAFV